MIDGNELVELLRQYGKNSIFHANTVATSLSFLRNGGLLSRQYVEDDPATCCQTLQKTDTTDKQFGVYNDIFFDVENIWEIKTTCFYGPVVFQYDTRVLLGQNNLAVSRSNPAYWRNVPEDQRYFPDVASIRKEKGLFLFAPWPEYEHIMLRRQGRLDFVGALEKVILYMPPAGADETFLDERNRPSLAYKDLAAECGKREISLEVRYVSHESWQGTVAHGNSAGRFYGFRALVPNVA